MSVYDYGGKSHSSPSFSYSRSHNPYYSEAQREEDRKLEQEERAKLEAQVASSRLDIPPSVKKKHPQASKQLWREFRRTIYTHHGKDTVLQLDRGIKTNSLSLGELVASGLSMETASQIYSKWDEYWSYTSDIIESHPLVPNSYPSSESLAEIEQKYIEEEIREQQDYQVATQKLRESAEQLYESGNYQAAYAQFQTVTKNAEYFYWNKNSLELNIAKCAIEIGKTEKAKFLADELVKKGYEVGQSNYIRGRAYEKEGSMLAAFQRYESALQAGYSEALADYERAERILFPESTMSLDEYKMYMAKGGRAIKEGRAVEVFLPAMTLETPPGYEQSNQTASRDEMYFSQEVEQSQLVDLIGHQKENTQKTQESPSTSATSIVNLGNTDVAVPGTKITYGVDLGDRIEPSDYFTFRWRVINDLSGVSQERKGILGGVKYPETIDLGRSSEGKIETEWDFAGTHTIEVEVYNQGSKESTHSIKQVVQDAQTHARDAFKKSKPPAMQPDVYLTWLSTQRELAASQGVEEKELQQIDLAIAKATELLGVTPDNPTGKATPIKATLVPTADPQPAPLQLYLKPIANGIEIVDLTNPTDARTYSGSVRTTGRQADNVEGEAAIELAIDRAWKNYLTNNPHPAGEVVAKLTAEWKGVENQILTGYSDGVSTGEKVSNWFSGIGLVAGLGGLALTVATGGVGTVAVGLFLVANASGVVAGGSNIADRVKHGNFKWDGETALDLVDIAGGLAGGTTAVLSLGGEVASVAKIRNAVTIAEAIETGSDVAGGVILGAQYLAAIEEIKSNPDLTPEQKQEQIAAILAAAAATGGLIVLGTAGGGKNKKGADVEVDASPDSRTPDLESRTTTTETPTSTLPGLTPDSPLVGALPEDLRGKVSIVVDESLNAGTVKAYYQPDVHLKIGRDATAADIQLHVPTLRVLQRYQGLTGKIRALIERITNWIKRNGEPPVFSRAWEAKLELEKLPAIIEARQARLASVDLDADTRTQLEAEIADLEEQIAYHTRNLDEMDTNPGRGYVAVEFKVDTDLFADKLNNASQTITTKLSNLPPSDEVTQLIQRNEQLKTRNQEIEQLEADYISDRVEITEAEIYQQKQQLTEELDSIENELFSLSGKNLTLNNSGLGPLGYSQQKQWYQDIIDTEELINIDPQLQQKYGLALERQKAAWQQIPEIAQSNRDGLTEVVQLHRKDLNELIEQIAPSLITDKQNLLTSISEQSAPLNTDITKLAKELADLRRGNRDTSKIEKQLDPLLEERSRLNAQKEKIKQEIKRIKALEERVKPDPNLEPLEKNITDEEVWQRLTLPSDLGSASSSRKFADVLIQERVITSEQEIIDYIATLNPGGKTPKQIRRQIKKRYRQSLLKRITNPKLNSQEQYQAFYRVVNNLAPADKGSLGEAWHQSLYGQSFNTTHATVTTADAAAQGITLKAEEKRILDRVEGNTIVEVKTISGSLAKGGDNSRSEIEQFSDNIELARSEYEMPTSDGEKQQLNNVRYVFTLPEGVKANAEFMIRQLTNRQIKNFVSFEIFNEVGERKIINKDNVEQLEESILDKWLYPTSNK